MLSMTREGPYMIFGKKGKLVAITLFRFYVLKLAHPLLYTMMIPSLMLPMT